MNTNIQIFSKTNCNVVSIKANETKALICAVNSTEDKIDNTIIDIHLHNFTTNDILNKLSASSINPLVLLILRKYHETKGCFTYIYTSK